MGVVIGTRFYSVGTILRDVYLPTRCGGFHLLPRDLQYYHGWVYPTGYAGIVRDHIRLVETHLRTEIKSHNERQCLAFLWPLVRLYPISVSVCHFYDDEALAFLLRF
jgi:hypothetical protein